MNIKEESEKYYNERWFDPEFNKLNYRHYKILNILVAKGLKKSSKVLEAGCGYGLLSDLIIKKIKSEGVFEGVDISSKAISYLNEKYKNNKNISFAFEDMKNYDYKSKYDFIIFPDVLEHIPVEDHFIIFENLKKAIHQDTKILINNPSPHLLNYYHMNNQSRLQLVDQPLHISHFEELSKVLNFHISSIYRYKLWHDFFDYEFIELSKSPLIFSPINKVEYYFNKFRDSLKYIKNSFIL